MLTRSRKLNNSEPNHLVYILANRYYTAKYSTPKHSSTLYISTSHSKNQESNLWIHLNDCLRLYTTLNTQTVMFLRLHNFFLYKEQTLNAPGSCQYRKPFELWSVPPPAANIKVMKMSPIMKRKTWNLTKKKEKCYLTYTHHTPRIYIHKLHVISKIRLFHPLSLYRRNKPFFSFKGCLWQLVKWLDFTVIKMTF